MNRKYNLKLDLQFRCNNSTMKFRQSDNKTSDFFIRITRSGELFDVNNAIAILAVIKPDNTSQAQFLEIKEGKVYADLNNNMKDQVGKYKAQALLIMEDERVSTDVIEYDVTEDNILNQLEATVSSTDEFTMLQEILSRLSNIEQQEEQRMINEAGRILSEENRKIEETKRVEAELIRQHEEADRAKYDATRESNENIRKINEEARISSENVRLENEANRIEQEANRVKAEQLRKDNYNLMTEDEERRRSEANAHKEAEVLRFQAETNRVNEEAKRRTTEQARVSAENTRVGNENTRKANETTRQTNETHRVEAETQRQSRYNSFITDAEANASNFENYTNTAKVKEEERKSNELDRKSQETKRVSNEVERISNENTRKANEKAREKNETSRQNIFENKVNEVDEKIVELDTTKDNFISSINTKVNNKISEIDNAKDNFVSNINTKVDTKISEIEVAKSDMTNTVSNKLNDVDEKIIEINATKDDFVSSVNTKVDSKISELDNTKSDMATSINNKVNEVENRFNALTSKQQQDAEVIDARDGETSLKARLDRDIEKAKQVYVDVEGSHISSDSSVGYAKDVEILGNTVQSASNLADIRSVGDKVEGQELYEIPVLSCGKNLFDGKLKFGEISDSTGQEISSTVNTISCEYTKVPNGSSIGVKGFDATSSYAMILEYDSSYNFIQKLPISATGINNIKTLNPKTNYIKFKYQGNQSNLKISVFLNETVATPYEPYIEDKLTILSPVQLEKVGDVADRIIEKDGVCGVEKNVVDMLFNETNCTITMSSASDIHPNYAVFDFSVADNKNYVKTSLLFCNKFNHLLYSADRNSSDKEGCWIGNAVFFTVKILKSKLESIDVNGMKKWLKANNINLKYLTTQPQFIPLAHSQQIKLRTFANKTNISFLTEIEGTIKAQVPKSLGATVNTHTEQIHSLNNELNRVKKLEESTVSTVTTESDFTTVEATSNGYFEYVKLEGKTLVNLVQNAKEHTLTRESVESGFAQVECDTYILDKNKDYTAIYIQISREGNTPKFSINNVETDNADYYNIALFDTSTTGYEVVIKKINRSYNWQTMRFYYDSEYIGTTKFKLLLLEGDHTQNPLSYFEGLKSVGQDVDEVNVLSCGKNLLNIEDATTTNDGVTFSYSNGVVTLSGTSTKDYITSPLISIANILQDGKCYRLSSIGTDAKVISTIRYMDGTNAQWADKVLWKSSYNKPFVYIQVQNSGTNCNGYKIQLQLEEVPNLDTQVTPYEPYVEDKKRLLYYNEETQTWEKPILREWDSIEKHADGKYYYHVRSIEEDYVEGDEIVTDYITDMTTTVKPLSQEKVYECTNIDLITYNGETNFIVNSGAITPRTTLKVHNNISNVVSLLQKKVSLLESNITSYMITQNRLMLASRYNADNVTFKVDYPSMMSEREVEIDYDLFKLIQDNIIVGPENYDVDKMLEIMDLYAMIGFITWEMWDYLYEVIDSQINPVIGDLEGAPEI